MSESALAHKPKQGYGGARGDGAVVHNIDFAVDTGLTESDLIFVLPLSRRAQDFARLMFRGRGVSWLGTWLFMGHHGDAEIRRLLRLNYVCRINGNVARSN